MRQVLSTALVAVIVGALAGITASTLAQAPAEAERVIRPAGVNADKVDGKHAVRATKMLRLRKNKLVSTDRTGFLPDNIVQPLWHLIKNKPAVIADGQVAWGEVAGKPPGFADDVDNAGVTKVKVKRVESDALDIPDGSVDGLYAYCPPGFVVIGGGGFSSWYAHIIDSYSDGNGWFVRYQNNTGQPASVQAVAHCLSVEPEGRLSPTAKRR